MFGAMGETALWVWIPRHGVEDKSIGEAQFCLAKPHSSPQHVQYMPEWMRLLANVIALQT